MHDVTQVEQSYTACCKKLYTCILLPLNFEHQKLETGKLKNKTSIVYVWSHYDGANIEQKTIGYGWCQNQEAKLYKLVQLVHRPTL